MIQEYFETEKNDSNKCLELLGSKGLSTAVKHYIDKNDKHAVNTMVNRQLDKVINKLKEQEIDDEEEFDENLKLLRNSQKATNVKQEEVEEAEMILAEASKNAPRDEVRVIHDNEDDDDDDDVIDQPPAKRGRGSRGGATGTRGGSATSTRGSRGARGARGGRGAAAKDPSAPSPTKPSTSARGRPRGRTAKPLATSTQRTQNSSIMNAFARQSQLSSIPTRSQRSSRANVTYDDSDDSD